MGIVVAELVTNSYDHAFPGGRGSTIVSVRRTGDEMATMTISDNGHGFKAKAESKRQGLGLVRRLIEQVGGTAMVASDHGAVWTIRFPAELVMSPGTVRADDYLSATPQPPAISARCASPRGSQLRWAVLDQR